MGRIEEVEGGWQPHRNNNGINYSRPLELSETKLPTKEHTWAVDSHYICSRGLPFLASVGKDVPNLLET